MTVRIDPIPEDNQPAGIAQSATFYQRKPSWFKVPLPGGQNYFDVKRLLREHRLHTVCEEAHCPNIGECFGHRTATFMVLGEICTRACRYCAVTTGRPLPIDEDEPRRVAEAVRLLSLKHAVITSVDRDDQSDGGAHIFAETIRQIRRLAPTTTIEVLIPDFQGVWWALAMVMEAGPDILNHNTETIPRLYRRVRPKAKYEQSLELLERASVLRPDCKVKSGLMVGLGEEWDELVETMADIRAVGTHILTIGQYLRPSLKHVPVARFYTPQEFQELRTIGFALGFQHVESGPLVRSSYHAHEQASRVQVAV
ncbi:MAG: lipoyl synthase [Chloroflexi bacterium]|nr:lipoyl synthase [Chloroflexota bacterium]